MRNNRYYRIVCSLIFASFISALLPAAGCMQKKDPKDRLKFIQFYDPQ